MKSFRVIPDLFGPASMFLGKVIGLPSSPFLAKSEVKYQFCCYSRRCLLMQEEVAG